MKPKKISFDYKWIVLVMCFLMVLVCLGFCSSTKALYLDVITKALEIPRTQFAFNESCRFISSSIINLFFGTLLYRFGARRLTAFGFLVLIATMLIYAYATNIYVFCMGGFLLGIGLTFTTTTMASSIIRRWFNKDLGKYTGIVLAGNGIGGAVATQIISPILERSTFAYRTSYLLIALILLITGTLIVVLLRERPKDQAVEGIPPTNKKKSRGASWVGIDFNTAKTRPYYYVTIVIVFLTGFAVQGLFGIYKAHMRDVGMDNVLVTNIVSIFSLGVTVSKILVGIIYDKYNLRWVMILCQGAATAAFTILAFIAPTASGAVFGFVFAIAFAFAMPLETLVIPLVANELFGNASYDRIFGYLIAANYAGYALGAPSVNLSYDFLGTYKPALLILAGVMLCSFIVFQLVINASNKDKVKVLVCGQTN